MAVSFVKGLKRDYVYLADVRTAGDRITDLPTWFDEYNRLRQGNYTRRFNPTSWSTSDRSSVPR